MPEMDTSLGTKASTFVNEIGATNLGHSSPTAFGQGTERWGMNTSHPPSAIQ